MKRKNKTLLTFMLAGALCAATLGGTLSVNNVKTYAAEEGAYLISDVFAKEKATFDSDANSFALFNISDEGTVNYKRNLALKWYDDGEAKYLTIKFAFQSLDFEKVDLVFESASAWATENDKAINTVSFTKENSKIYVQVNDGKKVVTNLTAENAVTLSLAEASEDGAFKVKLDNAEIGVFENIGANYAEYTSGEMIPFQVKADLKNTEAESAEEAYFGFSLLEINGQDFKVEKEGEDSYYVKDNAAPVLVVNEKLGGFLLGTNFSIDYEKIDVLQSSSLTSKVEYEQWSPNGNKKGEPTSSDLYFFETPYKTEDGKTTTVYMENGKEYVSIKVTLGDKVFKNTEGEENLKKTYDLTWYASKDSVETKVTKADDGEIEKEYIVIDRNEAGATYTHLEAKDGKNAIIASKQEAYNASLEAFQNALDKQAESVYAGSNSKITLPSVKWLIEDNNGFRNLDFYISYKTPSSASASATSALAYNSLKFSVEAQGQYEFKVFAKDKAGNAMKYYLDGELVDVTNSNIWDIEEIPTFSFEIENKGLKTDSSTTSSASQRKASEDVGDKYTLSDIKIVGATNLKETYALYRIDTDKLSKLDASKLTAVTYEEIASELKGKLVELKDSYFDLYLDAYAKLLAEKVGADVELVKSCFIEIAEFDDRIDEELHEEEWNKNNKYNWSISSQSFTAADEGIYVILADYWESELPLQRVAAYKVIVAETEADVLQGGNSVWDKLENFIKTNTVSFVLFVIAGVMLILIIILLFIKPSDETLEDVDKKAAEKKAKDKKED